MAIRRFYGHKTTPPKKYYAKLCRFVTTNQIVEFLEWAKNNCDGDIDYTIVHYGDGPLSTVQTEIVIYFKKKQDAILYKLTYL